MAFRIERGSGDDFVETHDINVTPFIDVMLVLLIIFMVAAPLATVDVPVNLPSSTSQPQPRPDKPIFITLKADRTLAIGDEPIARETTAVAAALDAASGHDRDQRVLLRADRAISYGEVMDVMNLLRAVGYPKVALVARDARDGT
jgi:biopolymer transport protein ExbD